VDGIAGFLEAILWSGLAADLVLER